MSEGYVLRTRPLGEADLIVTLLTAEEGKLHAVARTAKRSRRRFGAALEPLTRVRASWFETERSDLARLESCDMLTSYVEAQRDPALFYLFAYFAEVTDTFARERESDPRFYRLLGAVLDAAVAGLPPTASRRYFDLWTMRLQGLLPELNACSGCGVSRERGEVFVYLSEGRLSCPACSDSATGERIALTWQAVTAAREAMRRRPGETAALLAGEGGGLAAIDRMNQRMMLRFTERPLRTLPFLREIESARGGK